ncbi:Esterase/lipase/thioesterase [Blastosporella zonata]|nr:Esterase/lipase/thioesterase [Blastosporella zonata]
MPPNSERQTCVSNPITDATDPTLSCNDDGTSGALQLTTTVAAGSAITAYWNQVWPHNIGPMLTYLAQCPGSTCTGVNSDTLQWFKIDQAGLLSGTVYNGTWGSGKMIADNSTWTTTIPSTVPSGNYLIRFETIALHSLPAVCDIHIRRALTPFSLFPAILPRMRTDHHHWWRLPGPDGRTTRNVPWRLLQH